MFSQAIVRRPARSMVEGITSAPDLGKPDYEKALAQHDAYIEALEEDCRVLVVSVLEADEAYPDSCFVEDTAVLTRKCAIIDRPRYRSRQGEEELMEPVVRGFYPDDRIARIVEPGTLEGGDVMMVGDHFYVGGSERTNEAGIQQFFTILEKYGLTGSVVPLERVLHLKTGVNYLENNTLLVAGEFVDKPAFAEFDKIVVPEDEAYAANCIWVNGTVVVPAGYPTVLARIQEAGYRTITVDVSEFRKLDGGLSCLSLRFSQRFRRPHRPPEPPDAAARPGVRPCPLCAFPRVRSTLGRAAGQFRAPGRASLTCYANR